MAMMSTTKDHIEQTLLTMHFDENYIRRAFRVYESNYGYQGYTIDIITELITRLQHKDEQKQQMVHKHNRNQAAKIKLAAASSAPLRNKKKRRSHASAHHVRHFPHRQQAIPMYIIDEEHKENTHHPLAPDVPRSIIHKKLANTDNPWERVLKSKEDYVPQWVQCYECKKWRILLVETQNIAIWEPPPRWTCQKNLPFNKCLLPQQTDTFLVQKYSKVQLSALDIQRTNLIKYKANAAHGIVDQNKRIKANKKRVINAHQNNLKQQINALQKQNDEMKKSLSLYQGQSEEVDTLNMRQLSVLESKLQHGIDIIKEAKERLLENTIMCTVCLKHQKNIVIQECGHFDLCGHCIKKLPTKKCPRCLISFQNVIAVNH